MDAMPHADLTLTAPDGSGVPGTDTSIHPVAGLPSTETPASGRVIVPSTAPLQSAAS